MCAVEQPRQGDPRAHRSRQEEAETHIALRAGREEERQVPHCPDHAQDKTGDERTMAGLQPRQRKATPGKLF